MREATIHRSSVAHVELDGSGDEPFSSCNLHLLVFRSVMYTVMAYNVKIFSSNSKSECKIVDHFVNHVLRLEYLNVLIVDVSV